MDDHENGKPHEAISEITSELKAALNETRAKLGGSIDDNLWLKSQQRWAAVDNAELCVNWDRIGTSLSKASKN